MLTAERHDRIRAELARTGKVLACDLAEEFGVSEDTVRRDLRELARTGLCRRVYGGALLPSPDLGTVDQRSSAMVEMKENLARGVVDLVKSGQTIFVDAGSTNLAVARRLPRDKPVTVVTNAPGIAVALADHQRSKVIVLGGVFDSGKGACLGGQTLKEAQQIYADVLILGTCGVDPDIGITTLDAEEAELKRCMVRQSGRLIMAVTLDKLGTIAPYKIAASAEVDVIVVPQGASSDLLGRFEANGTLVRSVSNGVS